MRKSHLLATILLSAGAGLYLINASWLASPPTGTPRLVAQRGVAQHYRPAQSGSDCLAKLITPPAHAFIDNTLPSIGAAITAGADVVEIDIRATADGRFVLFHDGELSCRTNGSGRLADHAAADLQSLDIGYGYTADGGRTFPLRGTGVGLMPSLAELLKEYPEQRFLVQIKDGGRGIADALVAYLDTNQLPAYDRLTFFGGSAPLSRLKELVPSAHIWSEHEVRHCLTGYLKTGWIGSVPQACDDGMIIVPVEQANLLWGWPNRFLARMRDHGTEVMLIGRIDSLSSGQFSRLDTVEQMSRIPKGFDGLIWTDQIQTVGAALVRPPT